MATRLETIEQCCAWWNQIVALVIDDPTVGDSSVTYWYNRDNRLFVVLQHPGTLHRFIFDYGPFEVGLALFNGRIKPLLGTDMPAPVLFIQICITQSFITSSELQ